MDKELNSLRSQYGTPSTATALNLLFEKAKPHLTEAELKHLVLSGDNARAALLNLEDTVNGIAMTISTGDNIMGHAPTATAMLYTIANTLSEVNAMLELEADARSYSDPSSRVAELYKAVK